METLDKPRDAVASFLLYGEQRAEQASFGPSGLRKQIQASLESEGFGRCCLPISPGQGLSIVHSHLLNELVGITLSWTTFPGEVNKAKLSFFFDFSY